jgi:general secretion pathway protein C
MLDLFFKKYAWTANLALLFAAAWLCARTVNTVIGAVIRPRPSVDLVTVPRVPPVTAPPRLQSERLYALLGQKPPVTSSPLPGEEPGATQQKGPQNCWDRASTPAKSTLRASLVAAVIADRPRWSIASITDLDSHETRIYGVGDQCMGAQVLSVERLRDDKDGTGTGFKVAAIVCNGGRKEYLQFEPVPPVATPVAARAAPAAPAPAGPAADSVKKLADNRYEVKKGYIEQTLSNLNLVATQARIVPSFKNGVANGFKLFSIQPGSLYSAIGVENGDVIQRINGYEMNSPDKALEVYQKLRESPHITVDIERNGQTIHKEYNVTGS